MNSTLTKEYLDESYLDMFAKTYNQFRDTIAKNEKYDQALYSMHYPSIGLRFGQGSGLLLIGRALNGWEPRFSSKDANMEFLTNCNEYSKERLHSKRCPLQWLGEELSEADGKIVLKRSPFWQVAQGVVKGLYPQVKDNWTHKIAWTNLYKIAPADGGNPNTTEQNAQWPGVRYLLEMEILQLQPKHILFITGKEWAMPFVGEFEKYEGEYVQETGLLCGAKTVISIRPEQKLREAFVEEVLKAFAP